MDPPPVHFATTSDGFSIAYAVSGQGRPFVLLPGSFEHVQLAWQYPSLQPWLEGLAGRFQLIQIDERGAGMSTRGLTDDLVQEHYQRDIEAVIDKLNPVPFVLYAATSRVISAVQFTVEHPDRVFALILGPSSWSEVTKAAQFAFFNVLPGANWEFFLRSLVSHYQDPDDVPTSVALLKQAFDQGDFVQRMRVALTGVSRESLSLLQTPTLVLHPRDYMGPSSDSMQIAQLARATMALIDGAFALGDPEQGIRAIETFLDGIPLTTRPEPHPLQTTLSSREIEVLKLIAVGKSNPQIAGDLVISLNTVQRHVSNILAKTGSANRTEAAGYARDQGLS